MFDLTIALVAVAALPYAIVTSGVLLRRRGEAAARGNLSRSTARARLTVAMPALLGTIAVVYIGVRYFHSGESLAVDIGWWSFGLIEATAGAVALLPQARPAFLLVAVTGLVVIMNVAAGFAFRNQWVAALCLITVSAWGLVVARSLRNRRGQ